VTEGQRPTPNAARAGWYDDPDVKGGKRYWDGHAWTDQRKAPRGDALRHRIKQADSALSRMSGALAPKPGAADQPQVAPAGWHPDSEIEGGTRYWTGSEWAEWRINRDSPALFGCVLVGGFGHDFAPGTQFDVVFGEQQIALIPDGGEVKSTSYAEINLFEVGGRGAIQSGGGFIGGGFGLTGAAAGMVAATVLNGLTRRTKIETLVSIRTGQWQVILFYGKATPDSLKLELTAPFARVDAARRVSAASATSGDDHVGQLEKLAELHEAGALSDEEFAAAKARTLG
jgi:hypothetical protein